MKTIQVLSKKRDLVSPFCFFIFVLLSAHLCTSCASKTYQRREYLATYQQGDFSAAKANMDEIITREIPEGSYVESGDAVWLLLDKATIAFASGDVKSAIHDYNLAIEAIDFYNQSSPAETLGKIALQDELGAYPGEDYEQVLARLYFALALLHQGDMNNAYALLRQGEEIQQAKQKQYASNSLTSNYTLADNAIAKYVFATFLEKQGDISNAAILYRQAAQLGIHFLPDENLDPSHHDNATIIIICHNGNAPFKIQAVSDASIMSGLALELILGCHHIDPAVSSLTGIPVPALEYGLMSNPSPTFVSLNGCEKAMIKGYDVNLVAHQQLDQQMPIIVARGVARFLMRRSAIGYANERDPNIGALIDFAIFLANVHTKADTRSWSTLPWALDLARFEIPEGFHQLTVTIGKEKLPKSTFDYQLKLKPRDFCVINIFNIHPGVTTIQIPSRFLILNET